MLTIKEIKEGVPNIGLDLTDNECNELIKIMEKNPDGVLDNYEFVMAI